MKAPVGALVGLYYDPNPGTVVQVDDYLRTRTDRLYRICTLRRQQRGEHVGRLHLRCLVAAEAPPAATIHPLFWYPR